MIGGFYMNKKVCLIGLTIALNIYSQTLWAQAAYVEGKDYIKINEVKSNVAPGKVEVVEFFWYGCPHCFRLQKPWVTWLGANANKVDYHAQPAVLGRNWEIMAKAYHAMVDTGGFDSSLHENFFNALHVQNKKIQEVESDGPVELFKFVEQEKGKSYAEKFKQNFTSFSMGVKIAKDRELQKTYALEGTPTIIVAGKYSVNPATAGSESNIVPVVNFLVNKVIAERKK